MFGRRAPGLMQVPPTTVNHISEQSVRHNTYCNIGRSLIPREVESRQRQSLSTSLPALIDPV